ncbi:MAG: GNAT family N-acetyltransferase [Bacteroidota bacterium]
METIQLALSEEAVHKCWEALKTLHETLKKSDFLYEVRKLQVETGYHLVFIEKDNKAVSVIGFHISESLAIGKFLQINDLSTLEGFQGKGYISELVDWIIEYARTKKCNQIISNLESQPENAQAIFQQKGFAIVRQQFAKL